VIPVKRNGPMRVGVKGHSRWRLMVGACFWVEQPLTRRKKKECGLKMAADDGSVFFGGRLLTRRGKDRGRSETKEETAMMVLEMWLLMTRASTLIN